MFECVCTRIEWIALSLFQIWIRKEKRCEEDVAWHYNHEVTFMYQWHVTIISLFHTKLLSHAYTWVCYYPSRHCLKQCGYNIPSPHSTWLWRLPSPNTSTAFLSTSTAVSQTAWRLPSSSHTAFLGWEGCSSPMAPQDKPGGCCPATTSP